MKKSYMVIKVISYIALISSFSSVLTQIQHCNLHQRRIKSVHHNLKKFIHHEIVQVPNNIDNKNSLKEIWYQGGNRSKIRRIVAKKNALTKKDLHNLTFLITQEKKLLPEKITKITDMVNQHLHNQFAEAFKFKKSEQEIEEMVKEVSVSADELIENEFKTYNTILEKINQLSNINAQK